MKQILRLFLIFFRVGGLTFGGGYTMLPILQREVVEKNGWITQEELMDYYAVSQCIPGMIAVNTAIFIGYRCKKVAGSIAAALGVITPSIIIIMAIAAFIQNFTDLPIVKSAFAGINAAVAALVVNAIVKMGKKAIVDWFCLLICLVTFALSAFLGLSPVILILMAALSGLLMQKIRRVRKKEGKK